MSDIRQIDATFHARRVPAERSPAQDIAHELAKTGDGKIADNMHPHVIHTVDQPTHVVANAAKPNVDVPRTTQGSTWTAAAVTADAATEKQLSVALLPTGITEALPGSRVYGVHLLASTYLSELVTRGALVPEGLPDVTPPTMTNTSWQPHAAVSDVPSDLSETTHETSLHEEVVAALSLLIEGEATEATSHAPSRGSALVAPAEASTLLWPESSLRLTKQRDGSAVIWLRDYRMPQQEASQAVDVLVKGAKTAGIRLGRIILNGREVWTSPKNY